MNTFHHSSILSGRRHVAMRRFFLLVVAAMLAFGSHAAWAQGHDSHAPGSRIPGPDVTDPAQLVPPALDAAVTTGETDKPAGKKVSQKRKPASAQAGPGRYYVEFRARTALSYGHTFVVHGQLNSRGGIVTSAVAGLHPAGDEVLPWMIGHIIPVASETGASDGDTEDQYIAARYRINLTAEQYAKVSGYIRNLQASSPLWHAVWYNCNAFVGDIARNMGLQSPGSLEFPADYINGIRRMNGGRSTLPEMQAYAAPAFESNR